MKSASNDVVGQEKENQTDSTKGVAMNWQSRQHQQWRVQRQKMSTMAARIVSTAEGGATVYSEMGKCVPCWL